MLRIHDVAVALVREVAPVAEAIARQDADLARQLRSDQRGARRGSHYSMALRSAREAWSAVVTAAAWGYVEAPSEEMKGRFDQVIGTLHRVVHRRR